MTKFQALSLAACLVASTFTLTHNALAADSAAAAVQVPGEKVDSGLGDLPHYSKWADPTGKNPTVASGKASAKKDKAAAAPDAQSAQRYAVTFPGGK